MPNNRETAQQKQDIVCDCSGTTRAKILQLIDSGVDNIDRIAAITGAFTGCGACENLILELLERRSQ